MFSILVLSIICYEIGYMYSLHRYRDLKKKCTPDPGFVFVSLISDALIKEVKTSQIYIRIVNTDKVICSGIPISSLHYYT